MRSILPALALLSVLALPAAAHADTFTLTGSGGGQSGSVNLIATANGGGSFLINSISTAGISLIGPGLFDGNDNLLFPSGASVVDSKGFAVSTTQGDTSFKIDVFSTGAGVYDATFLDSDGVTATFPVTLSLVNTTATPEPSGLLLLGTGMAGLASLARRRLFA